MADTANSWDTGYSCNTQTRGGECFAPESREVWHARRQNRKAVGGWPSLRHPPLCVMRPQSRRDPTISGLNFGSAGSSFPALRIFHRPITLQHIVNTKFPQTHAYTGSKKKKQGLRTIEVKHSRQKHLPMTVAYRYYFPMSDRVWFKNKHGLYSVKKNSFFLSKGKTINTKKFPNPNLVSECHYL